MDAEITRYRYWPAGKLISVVGLYPVAERGAGGRCHARRARSAPGHSRRRSLSGRPAPASLAATARPAAGPTGGRPGYRSRTDRPVGSGTAANCHPQRPGLWVTAETPAANQTAGTPRQYPKYGADAPGPTSCRRSCLRPQWRPKPSCADARNVFSNCTVLSFLPHRRAILMQVSAFPARI
jgi:hypothetical protein